MTIEITNQIRIQIIPQLNSLSNHLWDTESKFGLKLDKIVFELLDILDNEYTGLFEELQ